MSIPSVDDLHNVPLITSADIQNRVRDLIGRAITRKLWLLLLDEERRQLPVLMPIEALPPNPPVGESMAPFLRAVCDEPARAVLGVWERPGGPQLTAADRGWLRVLAAGLSEAGISSAGMVLSHTRGCRWLPADEWV